MKNKLTDLNDHLFAQLERLGDESLQEDDLKKEIERSKAVTSVAKEIVNNARTLLDGTKFASEYRGAKTPEMLGIAQNTEEKKTP